MLRGSRVVVAGVPGCHLISASKWRLLFCVPYLKAARRTMSIVGRNRLGCFSSEFADRVRGRDVRLTLSVRSNEIPETQTATRLAEYRINPHNADKCHRPN